MVVLPGFCQPPIEMLEQGGPHLCEPGGLRVSGSGFRVQGSGPSISKDAEKGAHIPTSGNILGTIIHAMVWPRLLSKIQGAAHPLAARPCSTSLGDDLPSAAGCATDIRSTSQSSSPIPCVLLRVMRVSHRLWPYYPSPFPQPAT